MQTTRRQFLTTALGSTAVLSLSRSTPGFLLEAARQQGDSGGESILVVLQLSGGNDGLNTIVPYADDAYHKSRPKLRIAAENVLKIDDYAGFHPAMRGCADLMEAGRFAIVHGVGYPDPNRSHFESMDIWHSCRRKTEPRTDGWLGRYLDASARNDGSDVPAIHLGGEKQPFALAARNVRTPSIRSLERFRLKTAGDKSRGATLKELTAAQRSQQNDLLSFVQTSTTSALAASRRVEEAAASYKTEVKYPQTNLANKLRTVAQLIDAGLNTRIYYVELDGFDTHSQQAEAHTALLREFSDATAAFIEDLAAHGHGERVLLTAFSEFGRRVQENASEGTDHGAAAPMYFAGSRIKAGILGNQPSLTDLAGGDLKFHTDFRRVYATVLEKWLGWQSGAVLGGKFEPVDVLKS